MSGMTETVMVGDIVRETEKAILIDWARERYVWVPKSLTVIEEGVVWVANWFAKKNGIGRYGRTSYLVG